MFRDTRKIFGTLVGILIFIAVIAGLTYAMFTFSIEDNSSVSGEQCFEISYTKGTDIALSGVNYNASGYASSNINTTVTFYQLPACTSKNNAVIYIYTCSDSDVGTVASCTKGTDANLLDGVLKYAIVKRVGSMSATATVVKQDTISAYGDIAINLGLLENSLTYYTVYFWIQNVNSQLIDEYTADKYAGYVHATATQKSEYTS